MPELPEVETTRRGLLPHLLGRRVGRVVVREPRLRWPIPAGLARTLKGREVLGIRRRAKYLVFDFPNGHLLVHLGMSGRLTLVPGDRPAGAHDHADILWDDGRVLRFTDPRRFGAILWESGDAEGHALLRGLGLEPLEAGFTGRAMYDMTRGRGVAIKQFLMNARMLAGVGNIYASEALFGAGIHPLRSAGRISLARCERLAASVRDTLGRAIAAGGTTLRDFASADGTPGYFQHESFVYGREGKPCRACGTRIRALRQGQRSTFYCPSCQR